MNWYILKNISGRNVGPIGGARFAELPKLPLVKKRAVDTAPAKKVIHEVWSNQARHYFQFIQDRDTVALRHQSHKLININFLPGRILTLSDIHCILKYIFLASFHRYNIALTVFTIIVSDPHATKLSTCRKNQVKVTRPADWY